MPSVAKRSSRARSLLRAVATTDGAGSFTTTFTVDRILYVGGSRIDCADPGACTVSAALTSEIDTSAGAPIQFDPSVPPPPPPALTATPSTDLADGQTVTVVGTLTYTGAPTTLGWVASLPAGWSYASGSGALADVHPALGDTQSLSWAWSAPPPSPVTFSFTLNVPAGENIPRTVSATAVVRYSDGAPAMPFAVAPQPLTLNPITGHGADTDLDFRIGLSELTRVIELFNTRNGTVRTGAYAVATVVTEDGFALDPARAYDDSVTLSRYHSADANRDGKIGLIELTRVIELYNYRVGTVRTGQYHVQAGTEDGFAPGP